MRRKRLRGALVGFGKMAENGHLPGWLRNRRISLQSVCDPVAERRSLAAKLLPDAQIYSRLEEMLDKENLDFVDVCTPPPFHAESVLASLDRGLHVLCEKPFVASRDDFVRIQERCDAQDRIAFPVHNWKHAPVLARLYDWIREGRLGNILFSEFHTLRTQPAVGLTPWRGDKEEAGGGGILLDHGWHVAYLLLNFHREKPLAVSSWAHPVPHATGQAETSAHLLLEFPSSTASMYLTWNAPLRYNSARVYGDRGVAVLEDNRLLLTEHNGSVKRCVFRGRLSQGSHHPQWFPPVIERFLRSLEHRDEAQEAFDEARACLDIMLTGYQSIMKGGTRLPLSPT